MLASFRLPDMRRVLIFAAAAFFSLTILLIGASPTQAETDCWCQQSGDSSCAHYTVTQVTGGAAGSEFTCTQCQTYCRDRGAGWDIQWCDSRTPRYIDRCTSDPTSDPPFVTTCSPRAGSCTAATTPPAPGSSPTACVCDAGPNRNFSDCGSCEAYCVGGGHTLMSYGGRRIAHCSELSGTPAAGTASRTCRERPATGCAAGEILVDGTGTTDPDQCCRDSAAPAPGARSGGGSVTPTVTRYRCDACACDCDRNPATPAQTASWPFDRVESDTTAACLDLCSHADLCGPGFSAATGGAGLVQCQNPREAETEIPGLPSTPTTFTAANPGAAAGRAGATATLSDPLGGVSVPQLLGRVINAFLGLSGSLGLLVFIYGGFLWLTSGGSPEKITQGRNAIVWATLGLLLIFGAYAIVNFVLRTILGAAAG